MPDISALNGTALDNVAEFDGLTVTDPGINPNAATSGLLFTYSGAAAAYSVRQLNNNAPYVLRVRRVTGVGNTGNDDEADVQFDTTLTDPTISLDSPVNNFSAGGSNATTLGEFLNVGTVGGTTYSDADSLSPNTAEAYVTTWFDLTGNQNHAEQTAPQFQPQIHSGTVNTDLITENGKPALEFVTLVTSMVSVSNIGISGTGDRTQFIVGTCTDITSNASATILSYGSDPGAGVAWQNTFEPWVRVGSGYQSFSGTTSNTQHLYTTALVSGSNVTDTDMFIDGSTATAGAAASRALNTTDNTLKLGGGASGSPLYDGTIQEIIVYASDQITSNRTGIETDINDYFYAYNTSGFVVNYPGSIAAYSVRQLGNRQRYAMRVRRLGGAADYLDVGFVAGELDEQAIINFGGSDTLGVEVWYDQSRSGNDATNTDTTTMPIIYNGSSVITDGGKPALGRNSSGLYYLISNLIPGGVTQASFIAVTQGPDAGTTVRTWWGSGGASLNGLTTGNNLYVYNGGSTQSGSDPAVGRTLGIQLTDSTPGAAEKGWRNGVLNYSADSGPNAPVTSILGSNFLANSPLFMQEMILYPTDIDAGGTRIGIENNLNGYFQIF